jgi:NADH:ubiquinone oxidoreductase subunit 6 (subunit J)
MLVLLGLLFAAEIISAIGIVFLKDQMRAAILLAVFFTINTAIFFCLGQALLGIIQLLILVGGVSTYLILGTGAVDQQYFRQRNTAAFVIVLILVFATLAYPILSHDFGLQIPSLASQPVSVSLTAIQLSSGLGLLYLAAILLFAAAAGAVMLLKRRY